MLTRLCLFQKKLQIKCSYFKQTKGIRLAYVINLDEYADVGTYWIALYVLNNEATYFDSFGVEHIL